LRDFGTNPEVKPGGILERVLEQQKPVYLVNLALYPGKIEFDYLPENTQGVICQPIDTGKPYSKALFWFIGI
jgi:hypothetical protein